MWPYPTKSTVEDENPSALNLLEQIKEQLDRFENDLKKQREQTEKAIEEIKSRLDIVPKKVPLPDLGLDPKNLPALAPLLENPQAILDSPLAKMLPLLSNNNFTQFYNLFLKFQKGERLYPTELLPLARTLFGSKTQQISIQSNPSIAKFNNLKEELISAKAKIDSTLANIERINNETMALLEIDELVTARKMQVP